MPDERSVVSCRTSEQAHAWWQQVLRAKPEEVSNSGHLVERPSVHREPGTELVTLDNSGIPDRRTDSGIDLGDLGTPGRRQPLQPLTPYQRQTAPPPRLPGGTFKYYGFGMFGVGYGVDVDVLRKEIRNMENAKENAKGNAKGNAKENAKNHVRNMESVERENACLKEQIRHLRVDNQVLKTHNQVLAAVYKDFARKDDDPTEDANKEDANEDANKEDANKVKVLQRGMGRIADVVSEMQHLMHEDF